MIIPSVVSAHGVPLGRLIEQSLLKSREEDLSDLQYVTLMAASCLSVWAIAAIISGESEVRDCEGKS